MSRFFSVSTDKIQKASVGNSSADNFTMFVLFKPDPVAGTKYLLYNGYGVGTGQGYGINLTNLELRVDVAFVAALASGLYAKPSKWNRAVYLRRSGTNMCFLNGKKSTVTSTDTPFAPLAFYTIGARPDSGGTTSGAFKGGIKIGSLWSRAVSDIEALGLTKGIILPHQMPQSLDQNHYLHGQPGDGQPFRYGSALTVAGTTKFPEPPPVRSPFRASFLEGTVPVAPTSRYSIMNTVGM